MKKFLILILIALSSVFCYAQDTYHFKSSVQLYSENNGQKIDSLKGNFEITLWEDSTSKWIKFENKVKGGETKTYEVDRELGEREENSDTLLLGFFAKPTLPPFDYVFLRFIFVDGDISSIGVVTAANIKYYLIEKEEKHTKF